jgi:hypothetical protein
MPCASFGWLTPRSTGRSEFGLRRTSPLRRIATFLVTARFSCACIRVRRFDAQLAGALKIQLKRRSISARGAGVFPARKRHSTSSRNVLKKAYAHGLRGIETSPS